ncbi:MAG: MCD, Malonyl-CoA decarboxylase MCD [Azospirillum sp.]|nr:MCD, Malonyl-CoA decarboxylase MCD [Azospirillum sp.]
MNVTFLQELFATIAERGRELLSTEPRDHGVANVVGLCQALLAGRGEASGMALAAEITTAYQTLTVEERQEFFTALRDRFGPPRDRLRDAAARYAASGERADERRLIEAAEPLRQELLRRINRVPGNTAMLVAMRADLLALLKQRSAPAADLRDVDADFEHLLGSWFNRGFLVMRRIDWHTPAAVLDRIIRYEQVHTINGWDDLRRRIDPVDRRCYAFFHPALVDEPLIFVEVALTGEIPAAIAPLLAEQRAIVPATEQTTAVFYSISNTQLGLRGISFGSFLIKQVADELSRELPALKTFVTLSPVPGFAPWLAAARAQTAAEALDGVDPEILALADAPGWPADPARAERLRDTLMGLAAQYLLEAKNRDGRALDAVARFHLGNGARLERLNWLGDLSDKGLRQSHDIMVNYPYALADIEKNHEAYSNQGVIAAAPSVRGLLRSGRGGRTRTRAAAGP